MGKYWDRNKYNAVHEINERQMKCPVCGKIAPTRYFDEKKKKFIYRHSTLVLGQRKRSKVTETIYHEADH